MAVINDVCQFLQSIAPLDLAESWDNVGFILGDRGQPVSRIMTCLTVTPESAAEAIEAGVELIVTHHPLPFKALQRITTETTSSRLVWQLARAGVSVYSAHTAFDSALEGINFGLAEALNLENVQPLNVCNMQTNLGSGRQGRLGSPTSVATLAARLKSFLRIDRVETNRPAETMVAQVGIACGSGGSLLEAALAVGCDCFVTGETNFHTVLEANAQKVALILVGHYASERFSLERLANRLSVAFPDCAVWASRRESSPLTCL